MWDDAFFSISRASNCNSRQLCEVNATTIQFGHPFAAVENRNYRLHHHHILVDGPFFFNIERGFPFEEKKRGEGRSPRNFQRGGSHRESGRSY